MQLNNQNQQPSYSHQSQETFKVKIIEHNIFLVVHDKGHPVYIHFVNVSLQKYPSPADGCQVIVQSFHYQNLKTLGQRLRNDQFQLNNFLVRMIGIGQVSLKVREITYK